MEPRTAAVQPMQRPSLQQMLATFSPLMLDQTVSDAHLSVIATALVNWRSVCSNLGISVAEEAAIKEENQTADTRRYIELLMTYVCLSRSVLLALSGHVVCSQLSESR